MRGKKTEKAAQTRIPRIIHYCWFGGKPMPAELKECVDSWKRLEGYQVMEWNESNCSFDENEFVRRTYAEHQLGFIGDYYRLKAVYEYGGIYLDTDVKVFRDFEPLLQHKAFLNFIFDCSVGSAVIGAQKGNPFIGALLAMYENTVFEEKPQESVFCLRDGKLHVNGYATSNYYYTYYILKHYPQFRLNNRFQDMGDFVIYPKEYFEIGSLLGRQYTIHYCAGAWRIKTDGVDKGAKQKLKRALKSWPWLFGKVQILVRRRRYRVMKKEIPFYPYYLAQKEGSALPKL